MRRMRSTPRQLRDIRVPHAAWLVSAAALAVFVVLVWTTRNLQFYQDEWNYLFSPPTTPGRYFFPFGEHPAVVPRLSYQVLLNVFGLRTHVPEELAKIVQHVLAVLLLFRVVRRRAGDLPALGSAAVLLVLGWGAQIVVLCCTGHFISSVMFGLLAIDLLEDRKEITWRVLAAAAALLVACASSGVGLAFVVALVVQMLVERDRGARLAAPLFAGAAFVVWYLVVGRSYASTLNLLSPGDVWLLARYVAYGLAATVAAGVGAGGILAAWQVVLGLLVVIGVVDLGCRRQLDGRALGALSGALLEFGTAGLARAHQFGVTEAGSNRYMYVAVVFLMLMATTAFARLRWRPLAGVAFAFVVSLGLAGNIAELRDRLVFWNNQTVVENIVLRTVYAVREAPDLNLRATFTVTQDAPTVVVGNLLRLESSYGFAVPPESLEQIVATPNRIVHRIVDGALRTILAKGLRLSVDSGVGTCTGTGVAGFQAASGSDRVIRVFGEGPLRVALGWTSQPVTTRVFQVHSGNWDLHVPDIGLSGFMWQVTISSPSAFVSAC
jgi:hypothetical protein